MAFGDISVSNGVATKVYTQVSTTGNSARRIRNDTDLSQPEFFDLKHQEEGTPGKVGHRDRHLISLRRVKKDTVTGELHEAVINCTIVVPRSGVITTAELTEMCDGGIMRNFIVTANLAKLLRGEL